MMDENQIVLLKVHLFFILADGFDEDFSPADGQWAGTGSTHRVENFELMRLTEPPNHGWQRTANHILILMCKSYDDHPTLYIS
jgi:hypothetical protein